MNKLLCRLCNKTLRDNVTFEHAISIAHFHQCGSNDKCSQRDTKYDVADTFILMNLTPQEIEQIKYDSYMKQSNYNQKD